MSYPLQSAVDFLLKNKEWVFSGIGVALILAVLGLFRWIGSLVIRRHRNLSKARLRSGKVDRIRQELLIRTQNRINGYFERYVAHLPHIQLEFEVRSISDEHEQAVLPDAIVFSVPVGARITDIFDDRGGALLVLGDGGAGKTTLLVELARDLLTRAQKDRSQPIPLVLNLALWSRHRRPVARWIENELIANNVSSDVAQHWVQNDEVLPLFDCLDDVPPEHRHLCIAMINEYRHEHGLPRIVVCSRTAEYEALTQKLRLPVLVTIKSLTETQVRAYLAGAGLSPEMLGSPNEEDSLQRLLRSPLMLRVAVLALRGSDHRALTLTGSYEENVEHLFTSYVDCVFEQRRSRSMYAKSFTVSSLSWLASEMSARGWTSFSPDDLNLDWLSSKVQRWLFVVIVTGSVALLAILSALGILIAASFDPVWSGYYSRSFPLIAFVGIVVLLVYMVPLSAYSCLDSIIALERSEISVPVPYRYSWTFFLTYAVSFACGCAPSFLGIVGLCPVSEPQASDRLLLFLWGLVVLVFVEGSLVLGVWLSKSVPEGSLALGARVATLSAAIAVSFCLYWEAYVLAPMSGGRVPGEPLAAVRILLPFGALVALFVGLRNGGLFCVQHFAIRLLLKLGRPACWRYRRFLDFAADRLLIEKVGVGYVFSHKLFLNYFASQWKDGRGEGSSWRSEQNRPEKTAGRDGHKAATGPFVGNPSGIWVSLSHTVRSRFWPDGYAKRLQQLDTVVDMGLKVLAEVEAGTPLRPEGVAAIRSLVKVARGSYTHYPRVVRGLVECAMRVSAEYKASAKDSELVGVILSALGKDLFVNRGVDLSGIVARSVKLKRVWFASSNFAGADLNSANLPGAVFWGADLSCADLRCANLRHVSFQNADLRNADLRGADLRLASLWMADLRGAKLGGTDFQRWEQPLSLFRVDLRDTDLRDVNFRGVNLLEADLRGADLRGVDLAGTKLTKANCFGTDFTGADLKYTRGLSQAQVNSAKGNLSTRLPPGVHVPPHWRLAENSESARKPQEESRRLS
jgi:uncharacterized protein YjbI with pentapeptide repeats